MFIVGRPSAYIEKVFRNLNDLNASSLFVDEIAPALWYAASDHAIDPVGVIAQSYKETGAGRFGGAITAKWFNTAGIKIREPGHTPGTEGDKPLAHAMFPNWETGALAQVQHLRAYVNWHIPVCEPLVDPRYVWVIGRYTGENQIVHWSHLSTRWAPSRTYGNEIEDIMTRLRA